MVMVNNDCEFAPASNVVYKQRLWQVISEAPKASGLKPQRLCQKGSLGYCAVSTKLCWSPSLQAVLPGVALLVRSWYLPAARTASGICYEMFQ